MTSNSKQYNNTSIKETKANISLDRYQSNCEKKNLQDTRKKKKSVFTNVTSSQGERLAANIRVVQERTCLPLKWTTAERLSLRKKFPVMICPGVQMYFSNGSPRDWECSLDF